MTTTPPIDLETLTLADGGHMDRDQGVCLLEAVAWWAGEKHSDHPDCVSLVLAAFGRAWNDGMRSDEERVQLRQYVPLLVGTKAGPEIEDRRAWLALDWLARVCAPAWLRLAKLDSHADALLSLEPLVSAELAAMAQPALDAARTSALAAAWASARASAGVAAWASALAAALAAAWASARASAGDAAWASARASAVVATWASAVVATWASAGAAAGDALEPTVQELQASAHDLFHRMIALGTEADDA